MQNLQTCVKLMTFRIHSQSIFLWKWLSSPCLLLMGACKTLTALSRLFICQPLWLLCNLESLQGPQGQGTLNTDNMCGVSPLVPPAPPQAG